MKMKELYPSKYLKADDVEEQGGEVSVTMRTVKLEEMQDNEGNKDEKPVLYFNNVEKGLVLNKTNAERIAAAYGDESDEWRGKGLILYTEMVTAFGKTTNAIRVKTPKVAKPNGGGALGGSGLGDAAKAGNSPSPDPAEAFLP